MIFVFELLEFFKKMKLLGMYFFVLTLLMAPIYIIAHISPLSLFFLALFCIFKASLNTLWGKVGLHKQIIPNLNFSL